MLPYARPNFNTSPKVGSLAKAYIMRQQEGILVRQKGVTRRMVMKKMLALVVVAVFALPAIAWSASPITSLKDGKYEGTLKVNPEAVKSEKDVKKVEVLKAIDNQKVVANVKHEGENAVANVTYYTKDGKIDTQEDWIWNQKTITQKDKEQSYSATATAPITSNVGTYAVNCKDKANNVCDAGVDARGSWTLNTTNDSLTYKYTNVTGDQKADKAAKAIDRITITLKAAAK